MVAMPSSAGFGAGVSGSGGAGVLSSDGDSARGIRIKPLLSTQYVVRSRQGVRSCRCGHQKDEDVECGGTV